jgi:hypothetical protein
LDSIYLPDAVGSFFELYEEELPTVVIMKKGGIFTKGSVKFHTDKSAYPKMTKTDIGAIVDKYYAGTLDATLNSASPIDDSR